MRRCDYHSHTPLCLHAEGEPEAFVAQAISLGLSQYGIADHAPIRMTSPDERYDDWRMLESQLPDYFAWVQRAKIAAGDKLQILTALECDWLEGCEPWIADLAASGRYDYLIGSMHYVLADKAVDEPSAETNCPTGSVQSDWDLYWAGMTKLVQSKLFDIVGHCDLVKIWARYPEGDLMRYYKPFLAALRAHPTVVELNVAGWHKPCAEQYPACPLLEALMAQGTPICINSDAHLPEQVSRDWQRGLELLQDIAGGKLQQGIYTTQFGAQLTVFTA
ncbi:MAG: histidinol-phosphatase [Akkermansia sp.]